MTKEKIGKLRVGTSNIVVPGNRQTYPEPFLGKSRLNYYASLFNSLEVNSTFYKVPMSRTFEKWSTEVPVDFQFTIKLWKDITHAKNLQFNPEDIDRFMKAAALIGDKKGCLLIQFPGKITMDYFQKLEEILERISQQEAPAKWRTAIEFRSPTWYTGETFELLEQYDASTVLHDKFSTKNVAIKNTGNFIYVRYHGPGGDYRGSYDEGFLEQQSNQIKALLRSGKDVYAYFNNTMGSAFENARTLYRLHRQQ